MSVAVSNPDSHSAIDIRQPIRVMAAPKADVLAARVANLLGRLALPIAREARVIVEKRAWNDGGWARGGLVGQ